MLTILLGLTAAVGWGAPDPLLAQATRRVGPFPVVFGSIVIGTALVAPAALFLAPPHVDARAALLAPVIAALTVLGFQAGFTAFRDGAVSLVAPIIACEGGVAAILSLAGGEHLQPLVLAGLPLAVVGVVMVSMGGGGGSGGVLAALIAALLWGGVLALSAPLARDLGGYWAFVAVRGTAVILMLPAALARRAGPAALVEWWRIAVWGVADACAYLAFTFAAGNGPAAVAGVLAAQFGTVGALVALLFFGERLRAHQVAGIGVVAAAVGLIAAGGG
jgi:drug/metabolite transporter (DMT)-like permease